MAENFVELKTTLLRKANEIQDSINRYKRNHRSVDMHGDKLRELNV
jgi:hypothetical protein